MHVRTCSRHQGSAGRRAGLGFSESCASKKLRLSEKGCWRAAETLTTEPEQGR